MAAITTRICWGIRWRSCKIGVVSEDDLKRFFQQHVDEKASETQRRFEIVAGGLEKKIDMIIEALASFRAESQRGIESLREETVRGIADTQAMIRFSHAELDRRIRTLEQIVANLEARVERLETTSN